HLYPRRLLHRPRLRDPRHLDAFPTRRSSDLRYLEAMAPSTAASRSASSKTMKGALPPSSRESFLTVPAHWAMRILPISVEPVNRSEEHTSELQSRENLVCRLLLEKKKRNRTE